MPRTVSTMTFVRAAAALKLTPPFTSDDVKKARKARLFEVHPDRGGSTDAVQEVQDAVAWFDLHGTRAPEPVRPSANPIPRGSGWDDIESQFREHMRRAGAGGQWKQPIYTDEARDRAKAKADRVREFFRSGVYTVKDYRDFVWDTVQDDAEPEHATTADPVPLASGKHTLRFDRVNQYAAASRYHFTVIKSKHHRAGEHVVWGGRRSQFTPTREWAPGETIIADTSDMKGGYGRASFITETQAREQAAARGGVFRKKAPSGAYEPEHRVYDHVKGEWVAYEPERVDDEDIPF